MCQLSYVCWLAVRTELYPSRSSPHCDHAAMESLHHDSTTAAFEALFRSVLDAYLIVDPSGAVVRANRLAEELVEKVCMRPLPHVPTLAAIVGQANQDILLSDLQSGQFAEPIQRVVRVEVTPVHVFSLSVALAPFCVDQGALAGALVTLRDVTNSVVAAAQLSAISKNLPGVVFRYRLKPDGTDEMIYLSEGTNRMWQLSPQDCMRDVGLIWAKIHDEDRIRLRASVHESAKHQSQWKEDWRVVMNDGTIRWHRGRGTPTVMTDGSTVWDTIVVDVTDEHRARIRAEEANRRYKEILHDMAVTQQQLRQAVEIAQLGYWHLDIESAAMTWSDETFAIVGIDPQRAGISLPMYIDRIHPDDRQHFLEAHARAQRSGGEQDIEHRIIHPERSVRWLRIRGRSTVDERSGRRVVHGTIQDITDWQNALNNLREAYERFELAAEATQDAIWDWDIVNNTLFWGGGFRKLFGYEIDKITPTLEAWTSHVHPDDADEVLASLHACIEDSSSTTWQSEYRYQRSNGSYAFVIDRGLVMRDASGKATRMIGAMTDLSERREFEESLEVLNRDLKKRAAELVNSNAALEQFAYVASHDLQEPLRMVTSFLSMLERRYSRVLDDKGRQYIAFAVDGAKRMRRIILDLLEYSRAEKSTDPPHDVDMQDVVTEVLLLQASLIEESRAQIHVGPLPTVRGYRTPLVQVMQNLIGNALKYRKTTSVPVVKITAEDHGSDWEIIVEDNGVGIEPEYFQKIFVIFQRLQSRDETSGTGMGLAIVKKIVEHHGGRVWVESVPDVGSVFRFTISKM